MCSVSLLCIWCTLAVVLRHLVICKVVGGCVLTLVIVWKLSFHVYVLDLSLAASIVWILSAHLGEMPKSPTVVTFLVGCPAFLSELVGPQATLLTCSLSTVSVVLSLGPGPCPYGWATPVAGPAFLNAPLPL